MSRVRLRHGSLQSASNVSATFRHWTPFPVSSKDSLRHHETVGWLGHALGAAESMQHQGISICRDQAYCLLRRCALQENVELCRSVQRLMVHAGLDSLPALVDQLIRLFSAFGSLLEAHLAFIKVSKPSQYTWNSVIISNGKLGDSQTVIQLHERMLLSGIKSDKCTYLAILQSCADMLKLGKAKAIHSQILRSGIRWDVALATTLIDVYSKCGSLEEACKVFKQLQNPDVVACNAMIAGYTECGNMEEAYNLFSKFSDRNVVSWNTIIAGYAKWGYLKEARKLFDEMPNRDVVSWNAMITGYGQQAEGWLALECFEDMQHAGIKANKVTFISILRACTSIEAIEQGRYIHERIAKASLDADVTVANALVDMYSKCGDLTEARKIFDSMSNQDLVSWNTMITGYVHHGEGLRALNCFRDMKQKGITPGKVAYLSMLKGCSRIGAIKQGSCIHQQIVGSGLENDIFVGSTLVDMYAKCGNMEQACTVFKKLPDRNVVAWNAMIAGYTQCGDTTLAGLCFDGMQQEGIKPEEVTYSLVFGACSHAGLDEEGRRYFKCMKEVHAVIPNTHHHMCMVDLFSRTGHLEEAENFLKALKPNIIGWTSLLTACRTYGNLELAKQCFERVTQLDPLDSAGYMVMSGILSDAGMWQEVVKLEDLRQCAGAWKKPAKAWIEVNNEVHEFIVGDKGHPQNKEIYTMLKSLHNQMKEGGYMPKLDLVWQQRSIEDKEKALCGHCEKLAIAFGFISTAPGTTLRVTKNLRMCIDCHNGTKIISKIGKREIIIKDAYRMHHFNNGFCSCGDYY